MLFLYLTCTCMFLTIISPYLKVVETCNRPVCSYIPCRIVLMYTCSELELIQVPSVDHVITCISDGSSVNHVITCFHDGYVCTL